VSTVLSIDYHNVRSFIVGLLPYMAMYHSVISSDSLCLSLLRQARWSTFHLSKEKKSNISAPRSNRPQAQCTV